MIVLFTFCLVTEVGAQNERRDAKAVAMIKNLRVSRLDRRLPGLSFSRWFVLWLADHSLSNGEVNDCGEQDGSGRQRDFPICVQAFAHTGNSVEVTVMIAVGTYRRGIVGKPAVWGIWLKSKNMESELMDELSDLVHKLDQLQHRKS
jgi:hypothetical protein